MQPETIDEVVLFDCDGYSAKVLRADVVHWLHKGFVEKLDVSPNAPEEPEA